MIQKLLIACCMTVLMTTLACQVNAQEIAATLTLTNRNPKPSFWEYSPTDGGIITLGSLERHSTRNIALRKYNADFEEEWTKKVMSQNGRKNLDFMAVIGENILVFVSEFKPSAKVIESYYYRYNSAGELLDDKRILTVSPNEKAYRTDLQYVRSADQSTLLCYRNLDNRQSGEEVQYFIFDETGNQTRNGAVSLKYPSDQFKVTSVRVSNQGNVYFLGKHYKANRIRSAEDYSYLMIRYNTIDERIDEVPIVLGDRFVNFLNFKVDRKEHIYVAGFYSNLNTERITGVLFQEIGKEGDILMESHQAFGEAFLSNYLRQGQIERGRELRNFRITDPENGIILRSDGGVLLIAENFYVTTLDQIDAFGRRVANRTIYNYGDVIMTSLAPSGEIEWHAIVDKFQQTDNPLLGSYFSATGSEGVYIFHETNPTGAPNNVYINTIAVDGAVSASRPLFENWRATSEFIPRICAQVNNQEAIIVYFGKRGQEMHFSRLRL